MINGQACLGQQVLQKTLRFRELFPYLGQEGRAVPSVFQQQAVYARFESGQ